MIKTSTWVALLLSACALATQSAHKPLQRRLALPIAPRAPILVNRQHAAAPVVKKTLKRNCFGWYLDDAKREYGSVGSPQSLAGINEAVGTPAFSWGAYDHIMADTYVPGDPSTYYQGAEFLPYLQPAIDAKDTTIFVASPLPVHGYNGFTAEDTTQLDALIGVLKQFTDAGVTVWLRWAHEPNWYARKGSDRDDPTGAGSYYDPDPAAFVSTWKVIYNKVKQEIPSILHIWCPNDGIIAEVQPFWPGPEYVDIVALDYYTPKGIPPEAYTQLPQLIQGVHDTFAVPHDKPFWLGETGTRSDDLNDNVVWVDTMSTVATCNALPKYEGMMYFNYKKNSINHYLAEEGGSNTTTAFANLFGSTPGVTSSFANGSQKEANTAVSGQFAFNLDHLKGGLTTAKGTLPH